MSTSYRCPLCKSGTVVLDSRPSTKGIRRRRECVKRKCRHRFTTYESSAGRPSCERCDRLREKLFSLLEELKDK